jgi:signal transduction histidine kinase/ligand-binding sensor domain-containing protein
MMNSKHLAPLLFAMLLGAGAIEPALALNPARHISQYGHTAWRLQDGTLGGVPNAITQTADGYLWIGTQSGLVRFDGAHFTNVVPPIDSQQWDSHIVSLLGATDGSLWIGSSGKLLRWKDDHAEVIKLSGRIENIKEAADGTIWIARARTNRDVSGPLCAVRSGVAQCYGLAAGIPFLDALRELIDTSGDIWVANGTQIIRWNPTSATTYTLPNLKDTSGLDGIQALEVGPDGSTWVGVRYFDGLGLQRIAQDRWEPIVLPNFDGRHVSVTALLRDRSGSQWVGTAEQGIYRIQAGKAEHFLAATGLSSDAVNGIYEDHEGDLWVATTNGIDRFRDMQVASVSIAEGLSADLVNSILATRDGAIWFGNGSALDSLRDDRVSSFVGKNLPGKELTSILEDHLGRVWIGIDDGLDVLVNGTFVPIKRPNGMPIGIVTAIAEDTDNNMWAETIGPNGLVRIKDYQVQKTFPEKETIPGALALAADSRGGIWLGLKDGRLAHYAHDQLDVFSFNHPPTGAGVGALTISTDGSVFGATNVGVVGARNGVLRTLTTDNGLPCNQIDSLVLDQSNALWLYTQCGLVEISADDLQEWWQRVGAIVKPKVLGPFDGVHPGLPPFGPTATLAPDGKLWFANENVAQFIDPAHLSLNALPPPIHVEQLIADRKTYSIRGRPALPALTRDVEIDYTALSLVIPEKVNFRYKLEGRDTNWEDAGTRRQAFYTNLAPGNYGFRVIAANNDGLWNSVGDGVNFSIAAAWYQTRSFIACCVLGAIVLLWSAYRFRVQQIAKTIGARFDERMAERTRLAQELHDTLLQTIQGSKLVADDALHESTDPERMRATMRRLSQWLGQAIEEGRAALASLRVSVTERNDLAEALRRAAEECLIHRSMETQFLITGEAREMHPIARDEVYRIGYEAIRNACSHSGGTQLTVELRYAQDLTLRVSDNGVGMDSALADHGKDGHFGIRGMRERALRIGAQLVVLSSPTFGTDITLRVDGIKVYRKAPKG